MADRLKELGLDNQDIYRSISSQNNGYSPVEEDIENIKEWMVRLLDVHDYDEELVMRMFWSEVEYDADYEQWIFWRGWAWWMMYGTEES